MKISNLSVDRPIAITMIVLVIIIMGGISFMRLPLQLMPDMDIPYLIIRTVYGGASPEEIEKNVTKPIEEAVATLDGLDTLSSTSYQNYSLIMVELNFGTDLTEAKNDLRDLISRMGNNALPDAAEEPQILTYDPNSQPIITMAISGKDLGNLKDIVDNELKPDLEKILGVASVDVTGASDREIHIDVNQEQMLGYGLTLNQIASGIKSASTNTTVGSIYEGNDKLSIRTNGDFKSVNDIRKISILNSSGRKIPLTEIAEVKDTFAERNEYSFLDGKQSLKLSIRKRGDSNTVGVANTVLSKLQNFKKEFPKIDFYVVNNSADDIKTSITNVEQNFLLGGILAVIILFLFLRNVRSTIVIATAIPTSVIATFVLMYFGNLTLNMVSLGGLALGVGMLLDNAIVVLENIYRHRIQGAGKIKAAKEGTAEVAMAIIASTLTTVAVFVPVIFIQNIVAQLITPLSLTVAFSLLASLFVALTFVPMLSSKLLHVKEKHIDIENNNGKFNMFKGIYRNLLTSALKRRYFVLGIIFVGLIIFGAGLITGLIPLKMDYMPSADQGSINVYIDLKQNTRVERSVAVLKEAEAKLDNISEIYVMNSTAEDNSIEIDLELIDADQRKRSVDQIAEEVRNRLNNSIAGAAVNVAAQNSVMSQNSKGGGDIKIDIHGADLAALADISNNIMEIVKNTSGTRNIYNSLQDSKAEIEVTPKRELAKKLGFTESGIASSIYNAVEGAAVSTYREAGKEYDIVLEIERDQVDTLDKLNKLRIISTTGTTIPLEEVAAITKGAGYNEIQRENQERLAEISLGIYGRSLNEVQSDLENKINKLSLPSGYTISYGGNVDDMRSSFSQLGIAMILSIILVYMVMAVQFESLVYPFVVMFTVPLSLVGALLGLTITGVSLSTMGFIGIIMLVGIVVNNAIVMIDYINTRRQIEGKKEAILAAGQVRMRPIMMTTLTTVLAMVPLSLGIGQGSEQQQPMAIVVIAGLLFSTMLTLVVIPVIYDIVDDITSKFKKRGKKSVQIN